MQETLQLLLIEDFFDDIICDVFWAVVLRTFDDEIPAVLAFPHVAFHTIQTESMPADLFAVTSAHIVADIAEYFRHYLLHHLHLVLPLQRNWGELIFCAF